MFFYKHIDSFLLASGAFTLMPILIFLFPQRGSKLLFGVNAPDGAGGLFTRHWGLLAPSLGALLIFAAWHPALRIPVMLAAGIEKTGLIGLILADWRKPHTARMRTIVVVDLLIVAGYAAYLLQAM